MYCECYSRRLKKPCCIWDFVVVNPIIDLLAFVKDLRHLFDSGLLHDFFTHISRRHADRAAERRHEHDYRVRPQRLSRRRRRRRRRPGHREEHQGAEKKFVGPYQAGFVLSFISSHSELKFEPRN